MQTRSFSRLASDQSSNPTSSTNPNPKGQNRRRSKQRIENSNLEEQSHLIVTMTDNRTIAELLCAPTEGDVPNSVIKLILFPFSLAGAARRWLEKEPLRSIHTWEDLVSKFINEFFPPSRTTNLRNEISNFQQRFDESFHEAWDRYKDLLRACPHHGFTEFHQLDTFYNALNPADQHSLNAAAGGNLLERSTQDVLTIIENKSKIPGGKPTRVVPPIEAALNSFDCPPDSYHPSHPTYETYSGDTCGNDSHFGYDCPPQFPLNYEPEPGYIQNYNSYPHDSPSFPQQYPCCEDCRVTHEPYYCQPKNHDYYREQNFCYDSNSIGFDQSQPQQYTVTHPIFSAHHDLLGSQKTLNMTLSKVTEQMTQLTSMCEMACQFVQKNLEEKQLEEEQAVKAQSWKLFVCYDDDDDEEISNSLEDNIISELPSYSAVTPTEPIDSLSMGDEHLDTIPATKSDEFIKSCVENLVPNPSESEGENECDVPAGFTTFSNVLFDDDYNSDSSDDQSLSDEDVPEKIYSNPLFDEEIIPMQINQHSLNAESDLIKSMPNHDSSVIISSKIDSLFDEFAEIRFAKRLLYDNSSPRPPKEIVSDNSNADIECFSPSPIPNEDSDSLMEEIDLSFNSDDPLPSGIEDDDDSRRDVSILEELLDNYSLSHPDNESYLFDIPSPYRPPAKPPDGNTGTLNIKMMGDVFDRKFPIPTLTITRGLNQEKSPDLLSHLGLEAFQPSAECPMIINGKNTPILDVSLFHFYPP
nr:reverse transcriptase domain-containing protein [Tanacetum cinerariifolium]